MGTSFGLNLFVFGANSMSNFLIMPGHFDILCAVVCKLCNFNAGQTTASITGCHKKSIFRKIKIGNFWHFILITMS